MRIIHTADLHLGQILYQNYERSDEHRHFFGQLQQWCKDYTPDALLVSGDIFDIQQPSARIKQFFTDFFVKLHGECPDMKIVITAGNHDSASRIQADSAVWALANTRLIGLSPAVDADEGWEEKYIVRLDSGYIVALPYMIGDRKQQIQTILDKIAKENKYNKPVVLMGHLAVTGLDLTGMEIGKLATIDVDHLGTGYDYAALGHIHKPQTIGHQDDGMKEEVTYPAPVVRYSGSALHVSADETYPHSVSIVDIDHHGGTVKIKQLRIEELRHFYILPLDDSSYQDAESAIEYIKAFAKDKRSGYFRLHVDYDAALPSNFNQMVYDAIQPFNDEIRYNPKIIWEGQPIQKSDEKSPTFEVEELQQMTDPMLFIEKTIDQYPGFKLEELRSDFEEVKKEMVLLKEQEENKSAAKKKRNNLKTNQPDQL